MRPRHAPDPLAGLVLRRDRGPRAALGTACGGGLRGRRRGARAGALAVGLSLAVLGCRGDPEPAPLPTSRDPSVTVGARDGTDWWLPACPGLPDIPLCACIADYLALPVRAAQHARPLGAAGLQARLDAIDPDRDGRLSEDRASLPLRRDLLAPDSLAAIVRGALGTGFLLSPGRPLRVDLGTPMVRGSLRQHEVLVHDPLLGRFRGLLLMPDRAAPKAGWPGIVALHGHGADPELFRDELHGAALAALGYAVLIPELRAMCVDEPEDHATRSLLSAGFSLLGVRVAEAQAARRALASLSTVRPDRIGLVAHSTGALAATVAARVDPAWAAVVVDLADDYFIYTDMPGATRFSNDMAPAVFPYHEQINQLDTLPMPAIRVTYGFTPDRPAIDAFLAQHLDSAPPRLPEPP